MLNHILAALNDCALAYDRDEAKYTFISTGIDCLTGYTIADFKQDIGLWQRLVDPRDKEQVQTATDRLNDGDTVNLCYRIITKAGKRWVTENRSLFIDEQTGHLILLSVVKDIQREEEEKYNQEHAIDGYSILFDNNPNPMWIYELSTLRILKVNTAAIKTYRYTEEEFLTMTIQDIRPGSEREKLDNFLDEKEITQTKSGFNQSGVWKHMARDGSIIFADINGDGIRYKNRDCRIVVAVNVTEKIRSREDVKLREQFLNSLIDSQTNFLMRIDINGNHTFVNKQFLTTFGYTGDEIIGAHFTTTSVPEEEELCRNAFVDCITHPGEVIKLSPKKVGKKGDIHDTEWEFIAITDEDGQVTGAQGVGQDVTERNNAQKEIIWTKNNLEALINNTEDLIWSINRDNRYLYMNQAFRDAYFKATGTIPVKGDSIYLKGDFDEKVFKKWDDLYKPAFNGTRYVAIDETIDPETNETIFSEVSFNPIYNSEGKITGVGCFARNITERIKINKAISDQNKRLQNIASISSHDLRKPVATMLGLINIIDKEDFYNPENKEIIEHLLTVGCEIDDVIRLIVDSSFTSNLP
ncbi:PAS domain S-box-containing protein [Mucilaginibacter mallensis]|uniref:histidine kinase n=1 Tax=Mucilaginibacter mallensis TaxID=652787 RepID=A0A1H2CCL6_MUCMA|nr:PAS domain S-box protein [Mucilaginibacter mallensis]SDT68029.1 PAS domain S-box-containing protein [Mucilaginibacter mallensis]